MDLSSTSSTLTSKGLTRRERMQQDLALRQSSYFLQLQAAAPFGTGPSNTGGHEGGPEVEFVSYLERFGGFAPARELALIMHQLSFIADCLVNNDVAGAREHVWPQLSRLLRMEDGPSFSS